MLVAMFDVLGILAVVVVAAAGILAFVYFRLSGIPQQEKSPQKLEPISVNYHFTRQCNYACKFCFHTAKTSHVEPLENAKRGIKMLVDAGMKKLNFAGS
jgi:radical S-adenosyl methionine domain-containing protein 2